MFKRRSKTYPNQDVDCRVRPWRCSGFYVGGECSGLAMDGTATVPYPTVLGAVAGLADRLCRLFSPRDGKVEANHSEKWVQADCCTAITYHTWTIVLPVGTGDC